MYSRVWLTSYDLGTIPACWILVSQCLTRSWLLYGKFCTDFNETKTHVLQLSSNTMPCFISLSSHISLLILMLYKINHWWKKKKSQLSNFLLKSQWSDMVVIFHEVWPQVNILRPGDNAVWTYRTRTYWGYKMVYSVHEIINWDHEITLMPWDNVVRAQESISRLQDNVVREWDNVIRIQNNNWDNILRSWDNVVKMRDIILRPQDSISRPR